ncbi:MAG TPA: hypothetical protein VFB33_06925 [Candidatus Binataceae bacterium]|nr:hypothetical protein [Candidatus Binataceae bacterium]
MKLRRKLIVAAALLVAVFVIGGPAAHAAAAAAAVRTNIDVDCRCTDPVGKSLCTAFKQKVHDSVGYELVGDTGGFGVGVHFSCVDIWQGIDNQLVGRMSAVSVAFTIYSDKLPGEVYEDASVFRVGRDAVPEMSGQILAALGQIINTNAKFFDSMRAVAGAGAAPSAATSP